MSEQSSAAPLHPHGDAYRKPPRRGERGWPIGPIGERRMDGVAIGFCELCGANARRTTAVKGLFDCPECFNYWHDERTGEIPRTFDDYFSKP